MDENSLRSVPAAGVAERGGFGGWSAVAGGRLPSLRTLFQTVLNRNYYKRDTFQKASLLCPVAAPQIASPIGISPIFKES